MADKHPLPDIAKEDSLELPTAKFSKLEHNIVWVQYKNLEHEFGLSDAHAHTNAVDFLSKGASVHLVLDFRESDVSFANEARTYFANNPKHAQLRMSQAIVVNSLAHNLVANFYMKFNKPTCPVSIFSDPEKAVEWIRSLPNIN
jgi:hypothetical protein